MPPARKCCIYGEVRVLACAPRTSEGDVPPAPGPRHGDIPGPSPFFPRRRRPAMNKKHRKLSSPWLPSLFALLLLAGCAGKAKEVTEPEPVKPARPAWVDKGSGAFGGEMGKAFYGVGSAWGIQNPSLLRSTAESRARAEVARIFKTYTASLMKDYQASTMAGNPEETGEEQHVEQTIKTFTKAELAGVQIVDHWKDPETGEMFALARMDLSAFEDYLKRGSQLSEAARERVVQRAEKAFKELAEEEARHE